MLTTIIIIVLFMKEGTVNHEKNYLILTLYLICINKIKHFNFSPWKLKQFMINILIITYLQYYFLVDKSNLFNTFLMAENNPN